MNMEQVRKEVKDLENFEFEALTPVTASLLICGNDDYTDSFDKPGFYRVLSGSRGFVDEIEYLGEDESSVNILTIEEIMEFTPEEELEDAREYFEEWYMIQEDAEMGGVLNFGYTEEEFDFFFLVK